MVLSIAAVSGLLTTGFNPISIAAPVDTTTAATKAAPKPAAAEKKDPAKPSDTEIQNAVSVSPDDLVNKPHDYLGKNVKFTANFYAFSNLALDYKPAYRSSKTHLSLLVLKPGTHVPLSELKLAMMIPKGEKDPEGELLAKLKDGDTIEVVGKAFSAALDDPWVEIFKIKKIGGSKDDDKEKKASADADKTKTDAKADEKSETGGKSK